MGIIAKYSGIFAILFYTLALVLFMKLRPHKEKVEEERETVEPVTRETGSPLDLNDEDATVAALVAAIECRNEYGKNVQIVSIRKVG